MIQYFGYNLAAFVMHSIPPKTTDNLYLQCHAFGFVFMIVGFGIGTNVPQFPFLWTVRQI